MPSLSEILEMCEDTWDDDLVDPKDCWHENKREKMYCTLCEDCGIVLDDHPRPIYNAVRLEDGTFKIINP